MKKLSYEDVKQLQVKGLSVAEIARVFKKSRQRIYQILDKRYKERRRVIHKLKKKLLDK